MSINANIARRNVRATRRPAGPILFCLLAAGWLLQAAGCGEQRTPAMSVTGTPFADEAFSEGPAVTEYSYGEYDRLNEEYPAYFTVWNLKQSPLRLKRVNVTGKDAAEFRPLLRAEAAVPPGESVNFTIFFKPAGLGPKSAQVSVVSADPGDEEFRFRVSYKGSRGAVPVARTAGPNVRPTLVRAGAEYGLTWDEDRDGKVSLFFARLDGRGRLLGEKTLVATTPSARGAACSLVWTGDGFGLAWEDFSTGKARAFFTRLGTAGEKLGTDKLIAEGGEHGSGTPSLVWNGNGFGLAWVVFHDKNRILTSPRPPFFTDVPRPNRDVYFIRLSPAGDKLGDATLVCRDTGNAPALAWTGKGYGAVWADTRLADDVVYFAALGLAGERQGDPVRLAPEDGDSRDSALAWTGEDFAAAWVYRSFAENAGRDDLSVRFARLNDRGERVGEETTVFEKFGRADSENRGSLALAAFRGKTAVSGLRGNQPRIGCALLNRSGQKTDGETIFTGYPGRNHSIVKTDRGLAVAWYYRQDEAGWIYFAAVDE